MHQRELAKASEPTAPNLKPGYGASNRIVSAERAAMAKEIVSRKLAEMRRTMYSGAPLDPETLKAAAIVAADFIRKGATKFVAFSKKMIEKYGETIKPHLVRIYNEIKAKHNFPRMETLLPGYEVKNKSIQSDPRYHELWMAKQTAASVKYKLYTYLLDPDHPEGGDKAEWFRQALGFTGENADGLAKQIIFKRDKAFETDRSRHGILYNQVIPITGANGRTIGVIFGWIERFDDGTIRLTTAVPTPKKRS